MDHALKGEEAMRAYALEFLGTLAPNREKATIVGLSGDLGSGKTTFVQLLARELGIKENVASPTYVIAKFYDMVKHPSWNRLVHVDAYRIDDPEEMRMLKWDGIIADPKNLVFVEWPERLKELFPEDAVMLRFQFIDQGTRVITS